jgi:hypothetical protein
VEFLPSRACSLATKALRRTRSVTIATAARRSGYEVRSIPMVWGTPQLRAGVSMQAKISTFFVETNR